VVEVLRFSGFENSVSKGVMRFYQGLFEEGFSLLLFAEHLLHLLLVVVNRLIDGVHRRHNF
jgi:hypothetical protein